MKNVPLILILFFFVFNCKQKQKSLEEIKKEKEYYSFKKQISLDDKYEIISYCRYGYFAFSSDIWGTIIIKKGETFSEKNGYKINGHIKSWKNDTLQINRFDNSLNQPKDTIAKISYEKFENLTLKIFSYGTINASGKKEYKFDDYKVDKNQICFKNIQRILGEPIDKNKCFDLGNVEIINTKDSLTAIVIEDLRKSMDFKYTNSDGSITENLPEINIVDLYFIPSKKMSSLKTDNLKGIFYNIE